MAARQLPNDWHRHYHYRPVLMETFVDTTRFKAYRRAGWFCIGQIGHRKGRTVKDVYLRPLTGNCAAVLRREPQHPSLANARAALRDGLQDDPELLECWTRIIETASFIARRYDAMWLKRRRTVNTQLILLFMFRLVMSPERLGYTITLSELWQQCRQQGIPLYQQRPVSSAAVCRARSRLDACAFKDPHQALLEHFGLDNHPWLGHQVFTVNGSRINLPKSLRQNDCLCPTPNAAYPQGLVSCLYRRFRASAICPYLNAVACNLPGPEPIPPPPTHT